MSQPNRNEPNRAAQLLILGSYSALAAVLMAETVLLSWELWALPLIIVGVVVCWALHVRQILDSWQRLWVYAAIMMMTFFFYGIHMTSTYDMALVMVIGMLIFTMAREEELVTLCQVTYFVTLAYDLAAMAVAGTQWSVLVVTRTGLHIVLVLLAGWLARSTIRQWEQMFRESDERIAVLDKTASRMNTFMANLSHELRTPINAIQGMASVMLDHVTGPEARRSILTIRDAGNRMAEQISDIMDYSELEMGKLVVISEAYMLSSLFNDLVTELRPKISDRVELVIDIDADVPSGLVSDVRKLRKILFHIVGNSLKYTQEGGVYVHVSALPHDYGVNLCVEVKDTGIGMTQDEIEQVTQRFYQADSGKFVYTGGLGLGLPIAYGLVRSLGGFLVIDSQPQAGTTVRISIPQAVSDGGNCMSVGNPQNIHLGGFLDMGAFSNPHVREFYNDMLSNIAHGLGTPMHLAESLQELEKLAETHSFTHLFVGDREYANASGYLESLAERMQVIVVAPTGFTLPDTSLAHSIPKPLYGFPIASILNSGLRAGNGRAERIRCPGVHALVVDDEPMNLNVATGILIKYGMMVSTAPSGAEAIRMCGEARYDIVFMDHMMPGMDGVEAMKRIRHLTEANRYELPIVALTANALSSAREMFLDEGFDGFVSKPIEIPELERVLRRVLPKSAIAIATDAETAKTADADVAEQWAVEVEPASHDADKGKGGRSDASQLRASADGGTGEAVRPDFAPLAEGGVDVASGLRYCQEDGEFYLSLLCQYLDDHAEKRAGLNRALAHGDLAGYAIAVHALKSTSALIGAKELSDKARLLEAAAKEERADDVDAGHAELLRAYDDVAELISRLPGVARLQASASEEAGAAASGRPTDNEGDVLEFAPAPEPDGGAGDVFEFEPAPEPDGGAGGVFEFAPEEGR